MKVLIAFFICIVAVFGGVVKFSEEEGKKLTETFKESAKACVHQLKLDPHILDEAPLGTHPSLNDNACYQACVDQKLGVMNKDGTYNLENILKFTETAEERQEAENKFNTQMKECASIVGKNYPCKMAACIRKMPKSNYVKDE